LIHTETHISKQQFFDLLTGRMQRYAEALQGGRMGSLTQVILLAAHHNVERLRNLDRSLDFFGTGFWGYGINRISDGMQDWDHADWQEIAQLPGLNKHHEAYRHLMLMVFKVENDQFILHVFALDTCKAGQVTANTNIQHPMPDLQQVQIRIRPMSMFLDLRFAGAAKPVSFQLETLHLGGRNLSGQPLAQYYKTELETRAQAAREKQQAATFAPPIIPDFLTDFIEGIRIMQEDGDDSPAIYHHRNKEEKAEALFRDEFSRFFRARKYQAEPESKKGSGRIDLKVIVPVTQQKKIIEFKGWWNSDRKEITQQLCGYLSDFEEDGYVFMINHTRQDIAAKYQQLIQTPEVNYIQGSWQVIRFEDTGFIYYQSRHNYAPQGKRLHHFIVNIWPLTTGA
jgi:hypothetical protein